LTRVGAPLQQAAKKPRLSLRGRYRRWLLWKRHNLRFDVQCRTHPLRYLFLEVTRRCNLACRYCGSSCTGRELERELGTPQWIDVARQVAGDFDAGQVMVAVTGGEPLLKDGIFDLFNELHTLGFRYGLVTNGVLVDRDAARRMVAAGVGSVSISMDALPELNDQLRGKGSSKKVVEAVENLRAEGYRGKLEIITTVTTPALDGLDDMRKLVASMRVPLWRVAPVMPIGRAAEHPELVPGPTEVRRLLEFVRSGRLDRMAPSPEFSEEGYLGDRFEGMVRPYLCQCWAGITIAGIRYDGRIGACPELTDFYDQGDIRTERFRDVWENRYEVFRDRSWTKRGECADCNHFARCRGGSLHLYDDDQSEPLRCLYLMCKESEAG